MMRKPETKLMSGIFGQDFEDDHLYESVEGQTLHDALYQAIDHAITRSQHPMPSVKRRFKRLVELRFGFDGRSRTLEEVGKEFGVSRERVRQIEHKCLRTLRHPSRSQTLKLLKNGN